MENASKALIITASMLMGMMIISIAVYLFVTFGKVASNTYEQIDTDRLNQFNSQFTSYIEKGNLTIYDAISLANLATENNKKYEFPKRNGAIPSNSQNVTDNYIYVVLRKSGLTQRLEFGFNSTTEDINKNNNKLIKEELQRINGSNEKLPNYKCKCDISQRTRQSL